ncbi:unnamed protein product [Amoebophrya sp. A25]|nr:unnamed protein product [Amoebophrya sp. A25]|eukprot:GSA25T00013865001.1
MTFEREAYIGGLLHALSELIRQRLSHDALENGDALDVPSLFKEYCLGFAVLHPLAFTFFSNVDWLCGNGSPGSSQDEAGSTEVEKKSLSIPKRVFAALFSMWLKITRIARSVLAEQLVFAPLVNAAYLLAAGVLHSPDGSRSWQRILNEKILSSEFLDIWRSNVCFWGPVSLINFSLVKHDWRLFSSRLASIVWSIFLIKQSKQ